MRINTLIRFPVQYIRILLESYMAKKKELNKKKIIFWSFRGRGYSCNPKYITEYLCSTGLSKQYDIVWAFNNPEEFQNLSKYNIKIVKYYSNEFFQELMTSKFVITNTRFGIDFHKRDGQVYIQTWHGTMALKYIEKDTESTLSRSYLLNAKYDSKVTDYILSGTRMNTEIIRKAFWYDKSVLEIGNPRNDIFFYNNKDIIKKIKRLYTIDNNCLIVLYAPTFRNTACAQSYQIDVVSIKKAVKRRFHKECIILCRLHPNIRNSNLFESINENIIDVSHYDDMQELLCACDILITDFSSTMFDAAIMRKPCFLFALDFNEYISRERKFYFDVTRDVPFSISKNNEELVSNILSFEHGRYTKDTMSFCNKIGVVENGMACEKLYNLVLKSE